MYMYVPVNRSFTLQKCVSLFTSTSQETNIRPSLKGLTWGLLVDVLVPHSLSYNLPTFVLAVQQFLDSLQKYHYARLDHLKDNNEPRCEKTGLRGFQPGLTQTGLYNNRRELRSGGAFLERLFTFCPVYATICAKSAF